MNMISKIKNTMSDRASVNKAFVKKLGEWREKILPNIIADWDDLSEQAKKEIIEINDLYCGKHLVLNFQEYSATALYEWELVESDGKLGRKKHLLWDRKKESATLLAIRSFCNCFGPDADEAAGYPFEFKVHLDDKFQKPCYLQEYRGNRFNIPFKNASAVFFHKDHMLSLFNTFDESQKNKLVKSVVNAKKQML